MVHPNLDQTTWQTYTLDFQLGNIGAEVQRMLKARSQSDSPRASKALDRALELLDWTIAGARDNQQLELLRLRELVCGVIHQPDLYQASAEQLARYFLPFAVLARQ